MDSLRINIYPILAMVLELISTDLLQFLRRETKCLIHLREVAFVLDWIL